jgi:BirA family biotin operon repressor/biotin-[acetyl-CoA-carboxylase] ligase
MRTTGRGGILWWRKCAPAGGTALRSLRRLIRLAEAESTNTVALEWSRAWTSADLPAVVVAERQTAGRGRGANRWWSAEGALTLSVVLEPSHFGIAVARWPALSLAVGAAATTAAAAFAPAGDFRLKWPNDVFAAGRKLGGVLIEPVPERSDRLVIGIGLNVNNSLRDAPAEIRGRAATLCELAGGPVDGEAVLQAVVRQLLDDLAALGREDAMLVARWRGLCFLTGRSIVVEDCGRVTAGTCLGIDDDGALRVQTDRCVERLFSGIVVAYA